MNNESQKLSQAESAASKSLKGQSHKTDSKASSHGDNNDREAESAAVISKKSKHSTKSHNASEEGKDDSVMEPHTDKNTDSQAKPLTTIQSFDEQLQNVEIVDPSEQPMGGAAPSQGMEHEEDQPVSTKNVNNATFKSFGGVNSPSGEVMTNESNREVGTSKEASVIA